MKAGFAGIMTNQIRPVFEVEDLHHLEPDIEEAPGTIENYAKLGARPKSTKTFEKLKSDSSALVYSRQDIISPTDLVKDKGVSESQKGYVKKLSVWFDGNNEIKGKPAIVSKVKSLMKNKVDDENLMKK